jgi:RimJ/RimL family protein N-acetyltransferase
MSLHPDYPIRTPRLLVRPFTAEDYDDAFAYYSIPEVSRYLYVTYTPVDFEVALRRKIGRTSIEAEGDGLSLAIVPTSIGRMIGDVSMAYTSAEHQQGEIGFVQHPDHRGNGYVHEAANVLLRLGFQDLGLHRIVGRLDARNTASARVLERLGMRREAHLVENEWVKGEWTDEIVYGMLDREWRDRTG